MCSLKVEGKVRCLVSEGKDARSCPTLCDPMDYRAHGILQARILEWVAVLFSRGSSQARDQTEVSCLEILPSCNHWRKIQTITEKAFEF